MFAAFWDDAWDDLRGWLGDSGPTILITIAVLAVAALVFRAVVPPLLRAAILRGAHPRDEEIERRADTIVRVVDRTAGVALVVIGALTILPEVGVNITAILTGLGITGLALALGAQAFVRDAINGIFLLAEDQYRRGDVVQVAGVTGTVEEISLRRTVIRDEDGVVHSVPNGSIAVVSNFTRDFARVNVPVRVVYGEDLSRVTRVIERVGREMTEDARLRPLMTEPPRAREVESVGDAGVTITVTAQCRPLSRWEVAAELRRRLAEAFLAEGIHVPFATLQKEEPGQLEAAGDQGAAG